MLQVDLVDDWKQFQPLGEGEIEIRYCLRLDTLAGID